MSDILGLVTAWSKAGNPHRPIDTIAFQAGGSNDAGAVAFLKQIAQVTGGVAKSIV